jgi:hypothetical protein
MRLGYSVVIGTAILLALSASAIAQDQDDPFQKVASSEDVARLESIAGSLAEAEKLEPPGGLFRHVQDLRTAAYARLGALGTKESLAAVERVERKAKEHRPAPGTVTLDTWHHPCSHFADSALQPFVQTESDNGTTYALVRSTLLGGQDLFLISSNRPEDETGWSRPRLIPGTTYRGIHKPSLSTSGKDVLVLSFTRDTPVSSYSLGRHELEISVPDVLRDRDRDGWTDFEELRLGLNPKNPDSDGDGVVDGEDTCPSFAPPADHDADEEIEILQKAVFATFGVSDSWHLLIVPPQSRKLQVWGYRGPIIYLAGNRQSWQKKHPQGGVFVNWSVSRDGDEARVTIGDYQGPEAAATQHVLLKKLDGRWVVVERRVWKVA